MMFKYAMYLWLFLPDISMAQYVLAPEKCSPSIGKGGNLNYGGAIFYGKCEGGGKVVDFDKKILTFNVDDIGRRESYKDRTELSNVFEKMSIGKNYLITFDVRIPDISSTTNSWFYILQFWQGSNLPPFAGLRVDRGTSHSLTLIARNKRDQKGSAIYKYKILSGEWMPIKFSIKVGGNGEGVINVYDKGELRDSWHGDIGYLGEANAENWYRMKFGIYKRWEEGKVFKVEFRKMKFDELN